jgi:hypothetical protein
VAPSLSIPVPRSEGNRHMYNQALLLMHRVVAAEEYTMARHPLPPIPTSSQHARDVGCALGGRTELEQRRWALRGASGVPSRTWELSVNG